jgi:hypothetical protein
MNRLAPSTTHRVGPHQLTWEMFFDLMHGHEQAILERPQDVPGPGSSEDETSDPRPKRCSRSPAAPIASLVSR